MFNLFDLPLVPLEKLLKSIAPRELLILSTMNLPVPINKTDAISLTIDSEEAVIHIEKFWKHWRPRDAVSEVLDNYQKLSKLFKGPLDILNLDLKFATQLERRGVLPTRCRELRLHSRNGRAHRETFNRLLTRMQMDSLVINAAGCPITHESIFSLDRLFVRTVGWFTEEDLLRSNNRMLHVERVCFYEQDLNAFIKKWLKGEKDNVEVVIIESVHRFQLEYVLSEIETVPFHTANRDRYYFPSDWQVPERLSMYPVGHVNFKDVQLGVDLSLAVDIRRADGTWASVDVDSMSHQFQFFVWKDPRPSRALIRHLDKQCEELETSIEGKLAFLDGAEIGERLAINRDVKRLESQLREKRRLIEDLKDDFLSFLPPPLNF